MLEDYEKRDLLAAYALARGVVSVARAQLSPTYRAPADLAKIVAEESKRILTHERPSVSPLLGVTVDYSQIAPRGMADASSARAASGPKPALQGFMVE